MDTAKSASKFTSVLLAHFVLCWSFLSTPIRADDLTPLSPQELCQSKSEARWQNECNHIIEGGSYDPLAVRVCAGFDLSMQVLACLRQIRNHRYMTETLAECSNGFIKDEDRSDCLETIADLFLESWQVKVCRANPDQHKTFLCFSNYRHEKEDHSAVDPPDSSAQVAAKSLWVIAGNSNSSRFGLTSEVASANMAHLGYESRFFVGGLESPGSRRRDSWKFAENKMTEVQNPSQLTLALELALKKSPKGPILIYVNDHGDPPNTLPETAAMTLASGKMSAAELGAFLKNRFPADRKIKIIGTQCYSGSVHEIAFKLPNVCAASSTSFRRLSYSDAEIDNYGMEFFTRTNSKKADLDGDGRVSLLEAHFAAAQLDYRNLLFQDLSSFAYVDRMLKVGEFQDLPNDGLTPNLITLKKAPFRCNVNQGTGSECESAESSQPLQNLLSSSQAPVQMSGLDPADFALKEKLPDPLKPIFLGLYMKGNSTSDRLPGSPSSGRSIDEIQAERTKMKSDFDQLIGTKEALRSKLDPNSDSEEGEATRKQLQDISLRIEQMRRLYTLRDDDLKASQDRISQANAVIKRTRHRFERVAQFFDVATPEQKANYLRLLRCEMEPL